MTSIRFNTRETPLVGIEIVKANYWSMEQRVLRRVCERAGLPKCTFQNLRATCSSLLKQWGVAPAYVRQVIGHADEAVADAHYNKPDFSQYPTPESVDGQRETPMDLFARLCVPPEKATTISTTHRNESEAIPGGRRHPQRALTPKGGSGTLQGPARPTDRTGSAPLAVFRGQRSLDWSPSCSESERPNSSSSSES
jgi:hypothetical protein